LGEQGERERKTRRDGERLAAGRLRFVLLDLFEPFPKQPIGRVRGRGMG